MPAGVTDSNNAAGVSGSNVDVDSGITDGGGGIATCPARASAGTTHAAIGGTRFGIGGGELRARIVPDARAARWLGDESLTERCAAEESLAERCAADESLDRGGGGGKVRGRAIGAIGGSPGSGSGGKPGSGGGVEPRARTTGRGTTGASELSSPQARSTSD
jgi:hypothetical protein